LQFAGTETGFEALDGLRCEGNFRDEDDGAFALFEGVGDGLEIDFGFAEPVTPWRRKVPPASCRRG